MGSEPTNPNVPGNEPELCLLITDRGFEEPLWKSLFRELDDFFFPKKLPPLKLESRPEPVKSLWSPFNWYGFLASTGLHVFILPALVLFAVFLIGRHVVSAATPKANAIVLVDPGDLPVLKPGKT